jgi:hypothetical protein
MIIDTTLSKIERQIIDYWWTPRSPDQWEEFFQREEVKQWSESIRREKARVLPADDPRKLRLGWKIEELPGIVIVNDYARPSRESDEEQRRTNRSS